MTQFVEIGQRVKYIRNGGKSRRSDWPEGAWLEKGVTGTVTEYRPQFYDIEPWATVTWDFDGQTAIDAESENETWVKINHANTSTD